METTPASDSSPVAPAEPKDWPFGHLLRSGARTLAFGSLACSLLLSLGLWAGPERLWPISLAQYAPYPVILLPSLGAIVLAWFAGPTAVLAATVSTLLIATYAMDLNVHVPASGHHDLRVMTFNIKDYITLQRRSGADTLATEIARHDPDVLLMQDARTHGADESDSVWGRIYGGRVAYAFGQYVIASRLPMRECRTGWISFRDEPHSYAACTITVRDTDVDFITVHFTTPRFGLAATRANPIAGFREWRQNVDDRMTHAREREAPVGEPALEAAAERGEHRFREGHHGSVGVGLAHPHPRGRRVRWEARQVDGERRGHVASVGHHLSRAHRHDYVFRSSSRT